MSTAEESIVTQKDLVQFGTAQYDEMGRLREEIVGATDETVAEALTDGPLSGIALDEANTQLVQNPSGFRDALSATIQQGVADSPTVGAAVTTAITQSDIPGQISTAVAGLSLVKTTDPGIPSVIAEQNGYVDTETAADGTIIGAWLANGHRYFRQVEATQGVFESLSAPGVVPATDIGADPRWLNTKTDQNDKTWYGESAAGEVYIRKAVIPNVTDNDLMSIPTKLWVIGDSMSMDYGNLGGTFPGYLQTELGVPVQGGGISGQTSTEAGIRAGEDIYITVEGNTIPASASVGVTIASPTGSWHTGFAFGFVGALVGSDGTVVPGQLNKSNANPGVWSFQRAAAGVAVTVTPESRWVSTELAAYRDRFPIFRLGRNNPEDPSIIVRDIKAMLGSFPRATNYLVLSVYNQTTEPSGSAGYNQVMADNAALLAAFGPHYYDLRGWVIRNGLAKAGVAPTTADTTAIAQDRIPESLMFDTTHGNLLLRQVEAFRVASIIRQKAMVVLS